MTGTDDSETQKRDGFMSDRVREEELLVEAFVVDGWTGERNDGMRKVTHDTLGNVWRGEVQGPLSLEA